MGIIVIIIVIIIIIVIVAILCFSVKTYKIFCLYLGCGRGLAGRVGSGLGVCEERQQVVPLA